MCLDDLKLLLQEDASVIVENRGGQAPEDQVSNPSQSQGIDSNNPLLVIVVVTWWSHFTLHVLNTLLAQAI